ncbi:hypothetical protein AYO40_01150 [Planctomycetaceae bacterium SCGC AG-212-D15]|nr:hypothetical protein AYO40_01150 [Planctomycetaceae bacterium SCGC AG-212-D15]
MTEGHLFAFMIFLTLILIILVEEIPVWRAFVSTVILVASSAFAVGFCFGDIVFEGGMWLVRPTMRIAKAVGHALLYGGD